MTKNEKCVYCNSEASFLDENKIVCWRCNRNGVKLGKKNELVEVLIKLGEKSQEFQELQKGIKETIAFIDLLIRSYKMTLEKFSEVSLMWGFIDELIQIKKILEKK